MMTDWIDYDKAVALSIERHGDQGRDILHLSISRGETTARADKWMRFNDGNVGTSIRAHDLMGEIWRYAIPIEGRQNALQVPNQYRDEDGYLVSVSWQEEATGVRIKLDDLQRMLGVSTSSDPERTLGSSRAKKDPRGAKGDPRWEEILIEAARYMYARQAVGSQADLIKHVRQWLNDPDDGISDTAFKEHLGPLWRAFKEVDGG